MKKFLGLFSALMCIGISAHLALTQYNISEYSFPNIRKSDNRSANMLFQQAQPLVHKISQGVSGAAQAVISKGNVLIDTVIEKAKVQTFELVKDSITDKVDEVGSGLGISVSPGNSSEETSPIIFTMKKGEPAYFTIENRENERAQYAVDWKDGTPEDVGSLDVGKSRVVSHSWSQSGNYDVTFKIIFSDKRNTHHITLSIF